MRILSAIFFYLLSTQFIFADWLRCHIALNNLYPEIKADPEYTRVREYTKKFISNQLAELPKAAQKRLLDSLENDTDIRNDKILINAGAAGVTPRESLTKGLQAELTLYQKFMSHPAHGLFMAHELEHMKEMLKGNPHADLLRYAYTRLLTKDSILESEKLAARAEYKYIKGLYTHDDLQKMKAAFNPQEYSSLRTKALTIRRALRADPAKVFTFSKEDLALYDAWLKLRLDFTLIKRLEKAFALNEDEYATQLSTRYIYRLQNNDMNQIVQRAQRIVSTGAGILLAGSIVSYKTWMEDDDDEDPESNSPNTQGE
ncbi:MAG: hypothetical protein R3A80_05490 [Bdellovibrionota bacterium]